MADDRSLIADHGCRKANDSSTIADDPMTDRGWTGLRAPVSIQFSLREAPLHLLRRDSAGVRTMASSPPGDEVFRFSAGFECQVGTLDAMLGASPDLVYL